MIKHRFVQVSVLMQVLSTPSRRAVGGEVQLSLVHSGPAVAQGRQVLYRCRGLALVFLGWVRAVGWEKRGAGVANRRAR